MNKTKSRRHMERSRRIARAASRISGRSYAEFDAKFDAPEDTDFVYDPSSELGRGNRVAQALLQEVLTTHS